MDVVLYTGTRANQVLTFGMQPDFVWAKNRSTAAYNHVLTDSVRGAQKVIFSNLTNAEQTSNSIINWSYGTNQVLLGDYGQSSETGDSYVAWAWDAGTSTVSNTDGTITSSVRANPSAGFSIVSYTGTGANASIGHGLNAAPEFFFGRNRDDTSGSLDWIVYHKSVGNTGRLKLNTTGGTSTSSVFFQNTSPSSSVITIGTSSDINKSGDDYILYSFAPVEGYSAFGSYTGNGSSTGDGPFVYTGMTPRFVWLKRTDSTGAWLVFDTARSLYNLTADYLQFNSGSQEVNNGGGAGGWHIDILSNGFKVRSDGTAAQVNAANGTWVWGAFAEHPFKYSRAR